MSERIQAAIEASRERDKAAGIDDFVTSRQEAERYRDDCRIDWEPRFREALAVAVEDLRELAQQKTVEEVEAEEDDQFDGDMEGAYEQMIETARRALARIDRILAEETEPGGGGG